MTEAERHLWSKIRMKQLNGSQFYRQKIIRNYIVDFCCPAARLIIEADGGQHYTDEMLEQDKHRDKHLNNLGFKVLRFSDHDILTNIDGVIECILEHMQE